eukprot:353182-Chlamydomonas_euryale.AAC.29
MASRHGAGAAWGCHLAGLPWQVVGVMLAGDEAYYEMQQSTLSAAFQQQVLSGSVPQVAADALPLSWVPRPVPRKFGSVTPGDIDECKRIARTTGLLLDPIWTLAAFEVAAQLARQTCEEGQGQGAGAETGSPRPRHVVMLHTGGSELAMQGLAQRFPDQF